MTAPLVAPDLLASFRRSLGGRYALERELGRGGMGTVYLTRLAELASVATARYLPPA